MNCIAEILAKLWSIVVHRVFSRVLIFAAIILSCLAAGALAADEPEGVIGEFAKGASQSG